MPAAASRVGSRSAVRARPARRTPAGRPGAGQDDGNPDRRLVDEEPVGVLAVVAESLAVIGEDRHQQPIACLAAGRVQQAAEAVVRERDFPVVWPRGQAIPIRGRAGRMVRAGSYKWTHAKNGSALALDPRLRRRHHRVAPALRLQDAPAGVAPLDRVVVDVESTREPEAAIQHVGADESARRVAAALQDGGEGFPVRSERRRSRCRARRGGAARGRSGSSRAKAGSAGPRPAPLRRPRPGRRARRCSASGPRARRRRRPGPRAACRW